MNTETAGRILSVNVGLAQDLTVQGRVVRTAIFKSPVEGRVRLGARGFSGDQQADLRVHGGPYKAVYAYASEHYEQWKRDLDLSELPPGAFGENLTTVGVTEENLTIGSRYRAGSAILQVAQPRMPCYKLGVRFGRADMVKRFWINGRPGVYFSVEQEGEVEAGDQMVKVEDGPEQVTIADVQRLYSGQEWSEELKERALRSPLRGSWKQGIQERLTERL